MSPKMKAALAEKDAQVQTLKREILSRVADLPDAAAERVRRYIQGKLDVYQQALRANGNGKA